MRFRLVVILCAIALILPLLATPVLPLIDYYNHMARFFVLSHLSDPVLASNYQAAWALLPNVGLDVLAAPLFRFLDPLLAAKIVAGCLILIQFGGVLFLHHALHRRVDLVAPLLLTGILYSYVFTWGFANFLLGLGLSFWLAGLWVRLRDRSLPLATLVASLGTVLLLLCHGVSFALYGVIVAGFEYGRWKQRGPGEFVRAFVALGFQALVPTLLFVTMPTAQAEGATGSTLDAVGQHIQTGTVLQRIDQEFWHRLATVMRLGESPIAVADTILILIVMILLAGGLIQGLLKIDRRTLPAVVMLAVLCLVTPPNIFGVGYVSDRIPLALMLMVIASVSAAEPPAAGVRRLTLAFGGIAVARIVCLGLGWSAYSADYRDFQTVMGQVPRGSLITTVIPEASAWRDGKGRRCQMYSPLAVLEYAAAAPLFASPNQQPLRMQGPLAMAVSGSHTQGEEVRHGPDFGDRKLASIAADARFDYVLVCHIEQLTRPLPENAVIARRAGMLSLLKIIAPSVGRSR